MGSPDIIAPDSLLGKSDNPNVPGVTGQNFAALGGTGVLGQSFKGSGIVGTSTDGQGLTAFSDNDVGLFAQGGVWSGVFNGALVVNPGPGPKNPAKQPSDINGSVVINKGDLFLNSGTVHCFDCEISNGDCAEEFDLAGSETIEPGTVMCLDCDGGLLPSGQAYDKKVAGVISGAGEYRPGIVLDKQPPSSRPRVPLALLGKVYCKVDASDSPINIGDLLTTSSTPGHAMKAGDPFRAFGAVIGKALRPLAGGRGLIPILIGLQ